MIRRLARAPSVAAALALVLTAGCGRTATSEPPPSTDQPIVEPGQVADAKKTVIAFLGDSLTAGLGLTLSEAYPSRIQELFAAEGYREVEVMNAGVSGDTTAGGLRRVEGVLAPNVKIVVVALGGNDALRGLAVSDTRQNLSAIVDRLLDSGKRVMVAGMEGPTNLGEDYRTGFRDVFTGIARDYRGRITYVPFLLEGVAGNPALNQADGIHPNAQGARLVAEHLYPPLRDMVDQLPGPVAQ